MSETKDNIEEYDPAKKWDWNYNRLDDNALKQIAKDMYNNVIFSSLFLPEHDQYLISSIFMAFTLMGPGMDGKDERERGIGSILEQEHYENWLKQIGMIYENMSEAGPRGINGYPMFMSCKFIDIEDTKKVIEFYNQYREIREKADNF